MYDAVVITDPNGHILEVNPRTVEYFGRESDEVIDQPVSIFIPGLKQDVVLRIRKGLEGDRHVVVDANGVSKDGRKIACEVAVSCIDLLNPGDLIFTIRNVERRRAYMNAFRDRSNAFDISTDALFACDANGAFRECNAAFRALFDAGDEAAVRRRTFSDFFKGDAAAEAFRRALDGERTAVEVPGVGKVVLAPNVHVRKTVGVVGSVCKGA
jgi:PAS domain S-box-containing protein